MRSNITNAVKLDIACHQSEWLSLLLQAGTWYGDCFCGGSSSYKNWWATTIPPPPPPAIMLTSLLLVLLDQNAITRAQQTRHQEIFYFYLLSISVAKCHRRHCLWDDVWNYSTVIHTISSSPLDIFGTL